MPPLEVHLADFIGVGETPEIFPSVHLIDTLSLGDTATAHPPLHLIDKIGVSEDVGITGEEFMYLIGVMSFLEDYTGEVK